MEKIELLNFLFKIGIIDKGMSSCKIEVIAFRWAWYLKWGNFPDIPSPSMNDKDKRISQLSKALELALIYLGKNECGDSRAVSDEFVAMAAIQCECGDSDACIDIIESAIKRNK
jgi:hypothetical protein